MGIFEKKYRGLNAAQKKAVDLVEGPVMVVAGPGTGKTELLSVRVANILTKTDALAENILCLTFTESGANSMRERLSSLMGKDAYRIGVYTFHSFGSEVINRYSDYFYSGANFRPADELSTHQILVDIFSNLPHTNPLASQMNGEFSYLKNVQNTISDFKKSGLTPDEIQRLLRHNQDFLEFSEPILTKFFAAPIHKSMLEKLGDLYDKLSSFTSSPTEVTTIQPLSEIFLLQLKNAIEIAQSQQKVTALTAWRNVWMEKNKKNQFVFKDTARHKKLMAASLIYNDYLNAMQEASLYDYDDMILRLVHALEVFPELKFNLQEQYQYILVDEFQDTNGAQLRILLNLTDNPISEGKPNILVVGDDDQAIYGFQGAELSNLLSFQKKFNPAVINLRENYRSSPIILEHARGVITQSDVRLENVLEKVNKEPLPQVKNTNSLVSLVEAPSPQDEFDFVAQEVSKRIATSTASSNIAVLARNHSDIRKILPYFNHHDIPFSYEHRENILELPSIKALIELARVIVLLSENQVDKVNTMLPQILSHPAWKCAPQDLWQLSLNAHESHKTWLEIMQESNGALKDIADFFINTAYSLESRSLEGNIDHLYGFEENNEFTFRSPLGEYFFPNSLTPQNPRELIHNIRSLNHLRGQLKDYRPDQTLNLKDFIDFIDKTQAAHIRVNLPSESISEENAVKVMTTHKAKGQEFESVFIINATDNTWGSKSRGRPNRLSYPANLAIAPPGETEAERLRLFFVAMTRAKRELVISYSSHDENGKPNLRADFLLNESWEKTNNKLSPASISKQHEIATISWHESVLQAPIDLKKALEPLLSNYQLSVTHLNGYLDVMRGGPRYFLIYNLLRFPKSLSPQAALGSAIHNTLKRAHDYIAANNERRPLEDVLYDFEANLKAMRLSKNDFTYQLQKGSDALQAYLAHVYNNFSSDQIGERNFHHQGIVVDGVKMTGIVDVLNVNHSAKTITISDYKTGKPSHSWNGKSDYEKVKLHQYKQQLLFYKLLIEASADFRGYKVEKGILEFIEPDELGELITLELDYNHEDLEAFKKLMCAVWQKIIASDFIDTSGYPQNFKGILAFENDLLKS